MQLHRETKNFYDLDRFAWFWFPTIIIDVIMEFNKETRAIVSNGFAELAS